MNPAAACPRTNIGWAYVVAAVEDEAAALGSAAIAGTTAASSRAAADASKVRILRGVTEFLRGTGGRRERWDRAGTTAGLAGRAGWPPGGAAAREGPGGKANPAPQRRL